MNLPNEFKFRTKDGTAIYEAIKVMGGYGVQFGDIPVNFSTSAVKNLLEKGAWILVEPTAEYEEIGTKIGKLVAEKNKAYGDAFNKSGEFLNLLYPNGIQPEEYGDMLAIVRIFDKLMRIATDKTALGENPFSDIAGYGILKTRKGDLA